MTKIVTAYKKIWKIKSSDYTSVSTFQMCGSKGMRVIDRLGWSNEKAARRLWI